MEQANNALQNENGASENTPKTYQVKIWIDANGNPIMQSVTEDELINGYMRQSDYTRKTQELAEERKQLQWQVTRQDTSDDEDANVEAYLQSKGYAKADQVEKLVNERLQGIAKNQQDEETLRKLIIENPELKQYEWAIREIARNDNSALEDIVVKYGFSTHDKLSEAKKRSVMWWSTNSVDGKKPMSEWTEKDWELFEAQHKGQQFK